MAAHHGHLKCVMTLVNEGHANTNQVNDQDLTPSEAAMRSGHASVARFLKGLDQGGPALESQAITQSSVNEDTLETSLKEGHCEEMEGTSEVTSRIVMTFTCGWCKWSCSQGRVCTLCMSSDVTYCSDTCQAYHWEEHKLECQPLDCDKCKAIKKRAMKSKLCSDFCSAACTRRRWDHDKEMLRLRDGIPLGVKPGRPKALSKPVTMRAGRRLEISP